MTLTPIRYAIMAAALFTAIVHLVLGDLLTLLNGLGYLVLLAAFLLPALAERRELLRWVLIGYTAITIAAFFIVHADGSWQADGLGLMTKVVEVILILLLLFELQSSVDEA